MPRHSIALLLHGLKWQAVESHFELTPRLSLCRFEGSRVERLYHILCKDHLVDESDPFGYEVHLLFAPNLSKESDLNILDLNSTFEFYGVRSAIVHGGNPDYKKVDESVKRAFALVCGVLRKILLENDSVEIFNNEARRQELLQHFLFD